MTRSLTAAAVPALLLLAGCHSEATREKIDAIQNGSAETAATPTPAAPESPSAKAFATESNEGGLDFSYGWSAEAAAQPKLVEQLKADLAKARKEALETAADDKNSRQADQLTFNDHQFSREITTAGQSEQLLSLESAVSMFTGGAHPNHGTKALLWDRAKAREVTFASLFTGPVPSTLPKAWCAALDAERAKRRGGEKMGNDFDICPNLDEISVVPVDKNGDGKFEALSLIADPYVAGPYAEGDYEIALPWTAAMEAALKPEYRASFQPS